MTRLIAFRTALTDRIVLVNPDHIVACEDISTASEMPLSRIYFAVTVGETPGLSLPLAWDVEESLDAIAALVNGAQS